jgi:thiosulfate/3-mercaptopyruvate sulfurtransferase
MEWGGLEGRVAIMDGGLAKWKREGRAMEAGAGRAITPASAGALTANARLRATKADVVAMVGRAGMRIVDARDTVFYQDLRDNQMPRGGHIPTAVNLTFSSVTNADGTLKPRAELEGLVRALGIADGDQLTTYCHIGVQGSWMYFALRVLGRDVRVYDGSFDEWSRDASLPVEGAKPRP